MNYFIAKGLEKSKYDGVKLHATILTTKLRNTDEREQSFDAGKINQVGITDELQGN